jgi:translocator protein
MRSNPFLPILCIVALAATLYVNYLSNALPLNGQTPADISDRFPTLFTPAGYVFSIWGIIYLLLMGFVVYQVLPAQRSNAILLAIRPWFVASCVLNAGWIFAWHFNFFPLSLLIMLSLLAVLIHIYIVITDLELPTNWAETLLVKLPFRIYLAWICVASIANATILLTILGWRGEPLSEATWSALMIAVATGLGLWFIIKKRDLAFAAVLVWAFMGIANAHQDVALTQASGKGAAGALVVAGLLGLFLKGKRKTKV